MKELIKVIAFDADDTLWSNEPFFQEIEKQYTDLLKPYGTSEDISAALFQTEMNNRFFVKFGGTSSIVNKESWLSVVCFLPYCTSVFLPL